MNCTTDLYFATLKAKMAKMAKMPYQRVEKKKSNENSFKNPVSKNVF